MVSDTGAVRNNDDKIRMDLIPPSLLIETGKVLTFGSKKYGDRNWEKGFDWSVPYASLMRHITAWFDGEDFDEESRLNHLSHAACNIAMLIEFQRNRIGKDDRPSIQRSLPF